MQNKMKMKKHTTLQNITICWQFSCGCIWETYNLQLTIHCKFFKETKSEAWIIIDRRRSL